MRAPIRHQRRAVELSMTPMIDIVFLLMIFFIWTSSFDEPELKLVAEVATTAKAGVAPQERPKPEDFDEVVIKLSLIDGNIQWKLNEQGLNSIEDLRQRLTMIAESGAQPPVIVDPADDVPVRYAVEAFDLAKSERFDRVMMAIRK
jgi:biopolymer transport protein ExbD